jgi:hypothetical protein
MMTVAKSGAGAKNMSVKASAVSYKSVVDFFSA